tara:strand:- start:616 stop:1119 length:504 start_codon:yes stop_codon:yes gene_type:complete
VRKLFLLLILFCAIPNAGYAGIPQGKTDKWIKINKNWSIDTEDVQVRNGKLRFYMKRIGTRNEFGEHSKYLLTYTGKVRINCDNFSAGIQVKRNKGSYSSLDWNPITRKHIGYNLAKYFCFLTGSEGYTRETNEPDWVTKVINIQSKKQSRNINCDSPVWKNKPRCN